MVIGIGAAFQNKLRLIRRLAVNGAKLRSRLRDDNRMAASLDMNASSVIAGYRQTSFDETCFWASGVLARAIISS
jgi:hypothetical protein